MTNHNLTPEGGSYQRKLEHRTTFLQKIGVSFLDLFDPNPPKASIFYPTARHYLMHMKNIVLGKWQYINNSANIGPYLEFDLSMEISVQEDSGF